MHEKINRTFGFAKKSLAQNFLMHAQTAERIVLAAGITSEDSVLEIGPGRGMLTPRSSLESKNVVAVEADTELVHHLEQEFGEFIESEQLFLVEGDIRLFDADSLPKPYKIVANIPYYITGEIIRQFLSVENKPNSMTLLVQKEVAERIARSKKESLLSLSVKVYGTPKYHFTVPRGAFIPAPNVDSAVLSIQNIISPFKNSVEETRFFDILHAGFGHKRKQLVKNLELLIPSETMKEFLEKNNLSSTIRAEDVPLSVWMLLLNLTK